MADDGEAVQPMMLGERRVVNVIKAPPARHRIGATVEYKRVPSFPMTSRQESDVAVFFFFFFFFWLLG